MNELLKALYDSFYEKLPAAQLKTEIERCHQELIEKLSNPERKLVLQIIDCKDQIAVRLILRFWHLQQIAPCSYTSSLIQITNKALNVIRSNSF